MLQWLVAIYLVVGVIRAFRRFTNPNPAIKPIWMLTERNPVRLALYLTFYAAVWPFVGR